MEKNRHTGARYGLGHSPPATVTSRIIVGYPRILINLHFPLLLGGGEHPKIWPSKKISIPVVQFFKLHVMSYEKSFPVHWLIKTHNLSKGSQPSILTLTKTMRRKAQKIWKCLDPSEKDGNWNERIYSEIFSLMSFHNVLLSCS